MREFHPLGTNSFLSECIPCEYIPIKLTCKSHDCYIAMFLSSVYTRVGHLIMKTSNYFIGYVLQYYSTYIILKRQTVDI